MHDLQIDDVLELSYNDELREADEDELQELNFYEDKKGKCLKNAEKHLIITIGSQKISGFSSLVLTNKDLRDNTQKHLAQAMQPYGFRLAENLKRMIAEEKAEGFSYRYQAADTDMYAEVYIFKKNGSVYYLYLYSREEYMEENIRIFNEVLDTIRKRKKKQD